MARHTRRIRRTRPMIEVLEPRQLLAAYIEGRAWFDVDRDGLGRGGREYEVADVTVRLLNQDWTVRETTTTDLKGVFQFSGVPSGTYALELDTPDGTVLSRMDAGENREDAYDSDFDPATGRSELFEVRSTTVADSFGAGIYAPNPTSTIRGKVWNDVNGDGIQDGDEPGIPGAEVQLENTWTEKLMEVVTDDSGSYRIDGSELLPGDYVLDFVRPPRDKQAGDPKWDISPRRLDDIVDGSFNSDASPENGKTNPFTLLPADDGAIPSELVLDAGFFRAGRITGQVWHDSDRDGRQDDDDDEWGVGSVAVSLLDANMEVMSTTTTDRDGVYEFRGLGPGRYALQIDNIDGIVFSESGRGSETEDSDFGPATRRTELFHLSNSEHKSDVDAGVYSNALVSSLEGRVWNDWDADGVQDAGELGIEGAEVQVENSLFGKLIEVRTNAQGDYRIPGHWLLPGTYLVDFKRPPRADDESRWQISPRNIDPSVDPWLDNDAQPTNGKSPPIMLTAPRGGETNPPLRRDAGFFHYARITGTVWDDPNRDGLRADGEALVSRIDVQLLDANDHLVNETQTDGGGRFLFDELIPGSYRLHVVAASGTVYSPMGLGAADQAASRVNPANGSTSAFAVGSGQEIEKHAALHSTTTDSVIGGVAWDDLDGNGIRGGSESGLAGIEVRLVDARSRTVRSTTTTDDGTYRFTEIEPGSYAVQFVPPAGTTLSPMDRGDNDMIDSDVSRWSGQTSQFSLLWGQRDTTRDAAIYRGPLSTNTVDMLRVTEVGFIAHGHSEFVEIKNIGDEPVDLRGVRFTKGIRFDFTDSAITSLFPGEYAVVTGRGHTLADRFDLNEINVAGAYSGDLDRDERLTLVSRTNETINSFRYDDDWFVIMDNEYLPWTLTVIDESADTAAWQSRTNWRPSSDLGGTPGFDDPRTLPDPGAVVISEVLTKSSDGFNDRIEIHNTTDQSIDIGNWYLGDSNQEVEPLVYLTRYRIAPGTVIPANGYRVFSREEHFANPADPGTNTPFGLSSFGESIHLIAANEYGRMLGYSDSFHFEGTQVDVSFGRYLSPSGEAVVAPTTATTFGAANAPPQIGPVVIDEIMYNATAAGDEYIRLLNVSNQDVDLSAGKRPWAIGDAIDFSFPWDAMIPATGHAYVVPIVPDAFREKYGIDEDVPVYGPYSGQLSNGGENIRLFRHDDMGRRILIDQIHYDDQDPWPRQADFGDIALVRISPTEFGSDPVNWTHSAVDLEPRSARWDGAAEVGVAGDGMTWDDPNNWTTGPAVDVAPAKWPFGDDVTLGSALGSPTIQLGDDTRVNSLILESSYTLSGETLSIYSGVIEVKAGATAIINAELITADRLHKRGEGTLVIGGAVGDITMEGGHLSVVGTAGRIAVGEGTVEVAGSAQSIEGGTVNVTVDGWVDDIRVDVGDVMISGHASNVRVGSGDLVVDGVVSNLIVDRGDVTLTGTADSLTVADGTLIVNGSARSTAIEAGTLTGTGVLESLRVGSGGVVETKVAQENLTINGRTSLEGAIHVNVSFEETAKPITISNVVTLLPGSALELRVNERLDVVGEFFLKIIDARRVDGVFLEAPSPRDHLGHGVFVSVDQGGSGVVYEDNNVWTVLRQASAGDANGDGRFDQLDIVGTLQAGSYGTGLGADWTEGDWNGDGTFNSLDIVAALQIGSYLSPVAAFDEAFRQL